ncbi:hypothetical protein NHX12_016072 [Muraenolepis orangiensis]|uniref:Uncharacterized protein n=1 Tax=Muraenolepis orangiensis TaxID=630683 RepID=A0A9Q0I1D7_9TELE|nr:hypothetical protein NHX12_016072 [Muraenolepis orangiensis]
MASSETPPPSLRQGVRIAPHDSSVSVEEALLAAGEQVGHGNLVFASRVNKAVLVFVKSLPAFGPLYAGHRLRCSAVHPQRAAGGRAAEIWQIR